MKDKIIGCRAMTSTTSIIGNLTTIALSYVKNMFPNGYIKWEYVSETFNPAVMSDDECGIDNYKNKYQTLFIQPVWNPGDLSMELPRWHKGSEFVFLKHRNTYATVLEDWESGIFIYSIPNRLRVQMNCRIQLQTAIQAMDVQSYVSNHFDVGGYRYLNNIRVMTEIPITLIKPMCLKYGWDFNDTDDRVELNKYLMSHSRNGITQGKNLSTGNISYQYSYPTNILLSFPEEPTRDVRQKDLSVGESYVDFNFIMECWVPMNYLFEIKDVDEDAVVDIVNEAVLPDGSLKYTIFVDTDFYKQWEDGKQLIVNQQYYPSIEGLYIEIYIEKCVKCWKILNG